MSHNLVDRIKGIAFMVVIVWGVMYQYNAKQERLKNRPSADEVCYMHGEESSECQWERGYIDW